MTGTATTSGQIKLNYDGGGGKEKAVKEADEERGGDSITGALEVD